MGLVDHIYVDANDPRWVCPCGQVFKRFQTKSLGAAMDAYYLPPSLFRLRKLDGPNKAMCKAYTQEQVEERRYRRKHDLFGYFLDKLSFGDTYLLPEAWDPANRKQRKMGELPHQWVEMHTTCGACGMWLEWRLQFTDGMLVAIEPHHERPETKVKTDSD